ncbi:hypothetical protein BRADI_2g28434v3 [Brachypodium distachyon]|uniref:Uncharacterized protein n=1 Tax=Brachypodium distachyon TaxID=15368 RepID=A0A0Q3R018_BRADI|nr:hypothetical protein BRADI_2g28434v3 [Brachypodium distachyon]
MVVFALARVDHHRGVLVRPSTFFFTGTSTSSTGGSSYMHPFPSAHCKRIGSHFLLDATSFLNVTIPGQELLYEFAGCSFNICSYFYEFSRCSFNVKSYFPDCFRCSCDVKSYIYL